MNKTLLTCVLLMASSAAYGASQQATKSFMLINEVESSRDFEDRGLGVVAQYESEKKTAIETLEFKGRVAVPIAVQGDKEIKRITVTQYNKAFKAAATGKYEFTSMERDLLTSGRSVCVIRSAGKKDDRGRGILAITIEDAKKFEASKES